MVVAIGSAWASAELRAQDLEMQLFLPPASGGTTFTVARPDVLGHAMAVAGISGSYALSPLTREARPESGFESGPVVEHLGQAEALFALGLFELLELGLVLPVVGASAALSPLAPMLSRRFLVGVGDLRAEAKVAVLRGAFSLAGRLVAQFPLGDQPAFMSMNYWVLTPTAVAAFQTGPLTWAAEAGYRLRTARVLGALEQDDELHLAAGFSAALYPGLSAIAEAQIRIGVGGRRLASNENPMEVDAGLRVALSPDFWVEFGAGTGLHRGYGAPAFRAFAALRATIGDAAPCEAGPEDYDGKEDGDFCRDPDNDGDGIPDEMDRCVNDPEDEDGFADGDGCPDVDNDADGRLDRDDPCPTLSEDLDGYEDEDGCPEPDNDGDRVPDGADRCPLAPEDADGYQDEDGCPEPGPQLAAVAVTDTRILIGERVYFEFDRDTIRPVSMPLLDQVAEAVRELPPRMIIRVEGYADNEGPPAYNVDLSYRRARAVMAYLVSRGVPRARLRYEGYGARHSVAPNASDAGRALNRRVEFTILRAPGPAARSRRARGARRLRGRARADRPAE